MQCVQAVSMPLTINSPSASLSDSIYKNLCSVHEIDSQNKEKTIYKLNKQSLISFLGHSIMLRNYCRGLGKGGRREKDTVV